MIEGAVTFDIWDPGVKEVDLEDSGIMGVWIRAFQPLMALQSRPLQWHIDICRRCRCFYEAGALLIARASAGGAVEAYWLTTESQTS